MPLFAWLSGLDAWTRIGNKPPRVEIVARRSVLEKSLLVYGNTNDNLLHILAFRSSHELFAFHLYS